MTALDRLHDRVRQISSIDHAMNFLSWDDAVMMPVGGGAARGEAIARLSKMAHEMLVDEETEILLDAARDEAESSWEQANVNIIARRRVRARALPSDLVEALSKATSVCEQAWRIKRDENDWRSMMRPLSELFELTKESAQLLGAALGVDPYDALIDGYESGLRQSVIDPLFETLADFLPDFIDNVIASQSSAVLPKGPFDSQSQMLLAKQLMTPLGFDFNRGRIDTSHHPFTAGERSDTRITTRFSEDDFMESMFAVLHETGHALYAQGLPADWQQQPVGESLGMMLHESQSLFVEMQVCRNEAFLEFALPLIKACLKVDGDPAYDLDNMRHLVHKVERGKIRVYADECTYPLHIVMRYRIEQALLKGNLTIADIPDAWNDAMQEYFGIDTSGDYRDGCMQDVHWFAGLFGYFPCYALGALTAAQWHTQFARDVPDFDEQHRVGDFKATIDWLRSNIHSQGQLIPSDQLIQSVTGAPLTTAPFIEHLTTRYTQ